MKKEKVSIILPTYNRCNMLSNVIDSILTQTYSDFELLIIDDASTDQTKELVYSITDDRIRYFRLEQNSGPSVARNYGIGKALFDYIAFADSDDLWFLDKLQKQMEILKKSETDTGFCYHKIIYNFGKNQYAILPSEEIPLEKKIGNIYKQLLYDNMVACPSMLIRRECLAKAGGFDTNLKALEDYDLALRLAKRYKAAFVNEVLLESSYSTTGVSGNSVNYLLASCHMLNKYKADYLATETFNHRLEIIIRDAEIIGMKEHFVKILEYMMKIG